MPGAQAARAAAKKKSTHAAEQARPDVAAARARWHGDLAGVRVADLVFVDEFGATTQMQRTHGRAPAGERVVCRVPHGHWKCVSTVAAMTADGVVASASFAAATDGELFLAFARDLAAVLRPGQVVVLDNLGAHKSPAVAAAIEAAGARRVLLPPYSPDLNPIENAIAKVKGVLRTLARRTVDGLFAGIGEALDAVTAADAAAFIAKAGYRDTN